MNNFPIIDSPGAIWYQSIWLATLKTSLDFMTFIILLCSLPILFKFTLKTVYHFLLCLRFGGLKRIYCWSIHVQSNRTSLILFTTGLWSLDAFSSRDAIHVNTIYGLGSLLHLSDLKHLSLHLLACSSTILTTVFFLSRWTIHTAEF